jgi:nitric oxide reductase NorQ protein
MDRALVDRFFMLELDYMPPAIEAKVLAIRTGISNSDSDTVVAIGNQIRQAYKQSHISSSISTRHIFEIGKLIKDGFSRSTALELVMLPLFEGSRTEGEKATVLAMFMGR